MVGLNTIYEIYMHRSCCGICWSFKSLPLVSQNAPDAKRRKSGRPKDEDKYEAFKKLCAYQELNSEEQLTVTSWCLIMKCYLCNPDSEPYDNYNLKKRHKNSLGTQLIFVKEKTWSILLR